MFIDAHAHLALCGEEAGEALRRAAAAGIRAVVDNTLVGEGGARVRAPEVVGQRVHRAAGIHPWHADRADPAELLDSLRHELDGDDHVAIGEIGLDGGPGRPPMALQRELFEAQLDVAAERELPVVLHCHRAHEVMLEILVARRGRRQLSRGLLHGFTRGPQLGRRYVALGMHLGLGARLLDPPRRLREAAAELPLASLVLESDAPSASMASIPLAAAALAELRGVAVETIALETSRNARDLFDLPSA